MAEENKGTADQYEEFDYITDFYLPIKDVEEKYSSPTLALMRENKIDAIFNYGVLSTGFDAPNIKTVVIARPTTSIVLYSQMIGRGIRGTLVGGTGECRVVDIKDNVSNFGQVEEVYRYFDSYWK